MLSAVGLGRLGTLRGVLRISSGLGLADLRHTGRAELGGLVDDLRCSGRALRRLRRHPALSGDLAWRLAGIAVTALLSCLIDSPVTRALTQAAAVAALTIALTWSGKDCRPDMPVGSTGRGPAPGCVDGAGSAGAVDRAGPAGADRMALVPDPRPQPITHPITHPVTQPVAGPATDQESGPEPTAPVIPPARPGTVVVCRVVSTTTQLLVVVTVIDR